MARSDDCRQVISPERQAELEKRLDKSGHDVLQGTVATDSPNSGLLSGEFILPQKLIAVEMGAL